MRLAVMVTVLLPVASLLNRRVTREDLCSRRWRFPARSCITLPVPVRRNVFLAPLWVFIFGTSYLLVGLLTKFNYKKIIELLLVVPELQQWEQAQALPIVS